MASSADDLIRDFSEASHIAYVRDSQRPSRLRVALDVELMLLRDANAMGGYSLARYTVEQPWARNPSILGMRVLADPYMPRGVWRILASDDTLLHDPREGMTLREISEAYK